MKIRVSNLLFLYFGLILVGISGFFFTLFLPKPVGVYAFILAAALGGFGVAANIYYTKSRGKQLVCPTGSNCNVVVSSRYSKFLGLSLEYWGMVYFAIIVVSYAVLILLPHIFSQTALVLLVLLTLAAGLFSSYLLFVQAFLLRAWCIWCILAAFFSLTVFALSFISLEVTVGFLVNIERLIALIRGLGFALGVGGATIAIFLFVRFLKDLDIDDKELGTISDVFEMVWVGFGLTLISQLATYVSQAESLVQSATFGLQMLALLAAAFASAILMIIYAPFLVFVPFQKVTEGDQAAVFAPLRRPTVVVWSVVLVSWYFAFILDFFGQRADWLTLLTAYIGFLALAAALALTWEKCLLKKSP